MQNEIILIKQLPIIEEQLNSIKLGFQESANNALSLECTEDTYKTVKDARTQVTKTYNDLESKRKEVKKAILTPYDEFEKIYKNCVTDIYKPTKVQLDKKISDVENGLKLQKESKAKAYFEEYALSKNIDFVILKDVGLAVNMSTSLKSLKDKIKLYLDKVSDDLDMIDTQEHKASILVEYKKSHNVSQAILTVNNRMKAIEEEKKREQIRQEKLEEQRKALEEINNLIDDEPTPPIQPPQIVQAPIRTSVESTPFDPIEEISEAVTKPQVTLLTAKFTVHGTLEQLKELKKFMIERGIKYE